MDFITPSQYSKTNKRHYVINTKATQDFLKRKESLSLNDKILGFGCGTGETTLALMQGQLGDLGVPKSVLGVDISEGMIQHCKTKYTIPGLDFQQVDSSRADKFIAENRERYSLVTSFSCLHWVPNQPSTIEMFNRVLKPG